MRYTVASVIGGIPVAMKDMLGEIEGLGSKADFVFLPRVDDPVLHMDAAGKKVAYTPAGRVYHIMVHMYKNGELMALGFNHKLFRMHMVYTSDHDNVVVFEMTHIKSQRRIAIACVHPSIEDRAPNAIGTMLMLQRFAVPRVVLGDFGYLAELDDEGVCGVGGYQVAYRDGAVVSRMYGCEASAMNHRSHIMWTGAVLCGETRMQSKSLTPGYVRRFILNTFSA